MKILRGISNFCSVCALILYGIMHLYSCYLAYNYTSFIWTMATFCAPVIGPLVWTGVLISENGLLNSLTVMILIMCVLFIPSFFSDKS